MRRNYMLRCLCRDRQNVPDKEQECSNVDVAMDQLSPAHRVEEHIARERDEGDENAAGE
jgi:hypothetical protein